MTQDSLSRVTALYEQAQINKSNAARFIWVTFQRVGFHYYPQAKTDVNLVDVSYLGDRHRHLFKFRVAIQIFHNDRELEFHQFLGFCESQFETNQIDINSKSVEMLADELYDQIAVQYPGRHVIIEVSEDGECGCTIEYPNSPKALQD